MAVTLPFAREFEFDYGVAREVAPGVRRIVANNPSPFTFKGTNSYLVGSGNVALIDPGPDDAAHRDAILAEVAAKGERITHIFLTHTHKDHSAGLDAIAEATGGPVYGFGSDPQARAAFQLNPASEAILDVRFAPDHVLRGGEVIEGGDWSLEAVYTPGHAPDHLAFALAGTNILFSGDHVMGWNTSVVAPPEGNMADYIRSLELLLKRAEDIYFPGHGGQVSQAQRLVKAFIMHRRWRETQVLECIRSGLETIPAIVAKIYPEISASLRDAAAYSALAQIELLVETGQVRCEPGPTPALDSRYFPAR
jgi:glyoxylase-like metal-dependent hydrolase (beta-lactamase superfamily II)